ncbi:MAG: LAGLIDADG family homing endonuclease, partial [archaeon]
HVGDGTLYKTKRNSLVWELRGSVNEKEYYKYVRQLIKEIFNIEVKPKYRGINSYGIQTTNKIITQFFIDSGFKPGPKTLTVSIPEEIKKAKENIQLSFLRGLFDTDGCIRFDKNRTDFYYYPKIEFSLASKQLIEDLEILFKELKFRAHKWQYKRKDGMTFSICLAGFDNLDKWLKEVKPANPKHQNRVKIGLLNKNKIKLKKVSTNL